MNFNLKRNSIWAAIEVLITGISIFLLYRFVARHLGVRALGIWSLVLTTTSLARLGDIGASAGLSRFVALAMARGERIKARTYMETATITNVVLFGMLGAVLYFPLWWALAVLVPVSSLAVTRDLLPYAIASFVFMNINAVTLSALIGLQRSDLKSLVVIMAMCIQLVVAVVIVPRFGLTGLALGQVGQYVVSAAASWVLFLREIDVRHRSWFHLRFDRQSFRELIGFGVRLQALNVINFLYEPGIKLVLSAICGLEALGTFEMANRMLTQVRQVVVAPTQPLVPAFAHLWETDRAGIGPLYWKAVANLILIGGPLMLATALFSPEVSVLWLGRYNTLFVAFAAIGAVGWFINTVSVPSYLLGISSGMVRWNIVGSTIASALAPLLGIIMGYFYGPIGVITAAMFSVGLGALTVQFLNCQRFALSPLPRLASLREAIIDLLCSIAKLGEAGKALVGRLP